MSTAVLTPFEQARALSGALLVARDGRLLLRRATGLANREWNIPNTPTTRFPIASLGKQFVAAAIMQLADAGKLSIDDPFSKFYPAAPKAWNKVTLRTLLSQRSGIPDLTDSPEFHEGRAFLPTSVPAMVELLRDRPLNFEPGSKFAYDNSGYALLGYVIEKVSGQSFGDYMKTHILGPLGMKDTGYQDIREVTPQRASGYSAGPAGWVNASTQLTNGPYGLYSTVDDLLNWTQALFAGKVVSRASLKLMTTDWGNHYGFGLGVTHVGDHDVIRHSGGMPGYRSSLQWFPKDGVISIGLSNFDGIEVSDVVGDLAKACLSIPLYPPEVKLSRSELDRYAGSYQLSPDDIIIISREGDHLLSTSSGDTPTALFARTERDFFAQIRTLEYSFELDAGGRSTALLIHGAGVSLRLPRAAKKARNAPVR